MPSGVIQGREDSACCTSPKGFTLIELILVMAIVGILTVIAFPLYSSYMEKARASAAVQAIGLIQRTITGYYAETNDYPASLADIGMDTMKDPWGNPYHYLKIAGSTTGSSGGSPGQTESANAGAGGGQKTSTTGGENKGNTDSLGGGSGGNSEAKPRKDRNLVPINTDYDLYSMGPDGKTNVPLTSSAGRDDIVRASDGAFIGRACDY